MIPALKSEFRKMLTVRSTYVFVGVSMLIVAFFAGFINGFKDDEHTLQSSHLLMGESADAIVFVGLMLAFVGLLLAGHEYRYNTITYSLTSANRRWKVLAAKFITVSVFSLVAGLALAFFSPICTIIGAHFAGHHIGPQVYQVWPIIWHCGLTAWGYGMYALILLFIMRNQIGAIVTFLMIPLIGENILGLLLKKNTIYLPFTALQSVSDPTGLGNHTTSGHEAVVVLVYVAVGLLVSTVLFIKRDAN